MKMLRWGQVQSIKRGQVDTGCGSMSRKVLLLMSKPLVHVLLWPRHCTDTVVLQICCG